MQQDFEELDRQRRLKNTKIFFIITLILILLNMIMAYMIADRSYPDSSGVFNVLYTFGNALLMPFFITNAAQIFPKFRNSGARVRWFFSAVVIMFLLLLNQSVGLGYITELKLF
ncbi:hypothetical protein [Marinicellulosiphila megalodicopiae]|uniref:hypothetical protein n=1 Tax=Marinicellulosiphila megalodicopiae TaxID=2724896 RepID=UPI003BAEA698